jgi:TP901 family phage tail tape measure protein
MSSAQEVVIRISALDFASRKFAALQSKIESLNAAAKNTAGWREAGQRMAMVGTAVAAAGAGISYALWKTVDAAMAGEDATRHMMTAFDLSAPAAEQAKHLAETLDMVKRVSQETGISQDMLKDSVYNAKMMMLSDAQANEVAAASAKLAIATTHSFAEAQASQADVSLMLATAQNVLGLSASDLSDRFALLQSHYGFKTIENLNAAMTYILPTMKGVKTEANDVFAAMAVLSTSGYQSERIGTGMNELIAKLTTGKSALRNLVIANREGGPDIEKTTERLAQMTAGMSGLQRANYLKTLGFNLRDVGVMETLLDGVKKFAAARQDMTTSKGATDTLFNLREKGADEQWGRMWTNFHNLSETIGNSLLPTFNKFLELVNRALIAITNFAESHKNLIKFITTFAAISAAVLVAVGGLIALAGGLLVVASFGSTIGTVIAAIAGIGVAVAGTVAAVLTWAPKMFEGGFDLIKALANGIAAGAMYPVHEIEKVAKWIDDFIPHSPARRGALANLNRIHISEQIATAIKPGPAVRAMRNTAAAIAMTGAVMMPGAASAGGLTIQNTINITVNGDVSDGAALRKQLDGHVQFLCDRINHELQNRSRTEF